MKFSVIIPVYNKAETINNAIDSVLNQNFPDYEIIVVDDGSKDNLDEVLSRYHNVNVIKQENGGVSVARNTGINNAKGEFVTFLDADDLWMENHLQVLDAMIDKYPTLSCFCTSHKVTNENGVAFDSANKLTNFEEDFVTDNLFKLLNDISDCLINTNSMCIKRSFLVENQLVFKEGAKIGEDTDMWLRIALKNPIALSKQSTTCYRRENSTATKFSSNTLDWEFAKRMETFDFSTIDKQVAVECNKLLDRHKMQCSRDCLLKRDRKKARKFLKNCKYKNFKHFISVLFCFMPYGLFEKINKKYIKKG